MADSAVLEEFTRIDRRVRDSEKSLHTLKAQLESQQKREKEIYTNLGVSGYEDLKNKLDSLKKQVDKQLAEWEERVNKVDSVIRDIENRVGV